MISISAAQAGKILIATTPVGKSHMMNLKKIAKEVDLRGHRVMVDPFTSLSGVHLYATHIP